MRRAPRNLCRTVVVLAVLALVAGCSSSSSSTPGTASPAATGADSSSAAAPDGAATGWVPPTKPYAGDDFYAVPDPLPKAEHGTLLRYQPVNGPEGSDAYRIMYLSESVGGQPIAVTGDALIPKAAAPAGGRRVVTIAHGTTGIGDACAPSKGDDLGVELRLLGAAVADQGYLMVESDYEGLGTPGVHPYLVGESEGRGVIDAVPAASQLPNADASKDVAIVGYSQGGHGALWANQIAGQWAPDLHVVGTFAGAPATELDLIAKAATTNPGASGFFVLIAAGYAQAYPQAKIDQVLTPAGVAKAKDADANGCGATPAGPPAPAPGGPAVQPDAGTVQPWADLFKQNNPGQVTTADPILIIHSKQDSTVPVILSQILFNRMCSKGQVVERRVYDKGQSHVQAAPDAYRDALAWIADRFDGKPAMSNCPGAT